MLGWARSLRYFRYCRGRSAPFFTEPDRLVVSLAVDGTADRDALLGELGLAGVAGWHDLGGGRVHLDLRPDRVLVAVWGGEQRRTRLAERDVEVASAIEDLLDPVADRVVDPPVDDRSCLSPAVYPSVFAPT